MEGNKVTIHLSMILLALSIQICYLFLFWKILGGLEPENILPQSIALANKPIKHFILSVIEG